MIDLEKIDDRISVKVTRIRSPFDISLVEIFIGFLVDEEGNFVRSPEIGKPICLNGEEKGPPWLFRTDEIFKLDIFTSEWEATTEKGVKYRIEHERVYH